MDDKENLKVSIKVSNFCQKKTFLLWQRKFGEKEKNGIVWNRPNEKIQEKFW